MLSGRHRIKHEMVFCLLQLKNTISLSLWSMRPPQTTFCSTEYDKRWSNQSHSLTPDDRIKHTRQDKIPQTSLTTHSFCWLIYTSHRHRRPVRRTFHPSTLCLISRLALPPTTYIHTTHNISLQTDSGGGVLWRVESGRGVESVGSSGGQLLLDPGVLGQVGQFHALRLLLHQQSVKRRKGEKKIWGVHTCLDVAQNVWIHAICSPQS